MLLYKGADISSSGSLENRGETSLVRREPRVPTVSSAARDLPVVEPITRYLRYRRIDAGIGDWRDGWIWGDLISKRPKSEL